MLNRRTLLKGIAGTGAALILPPTLTENAETARERCARCYGPTYGSTTWVNGRGERLCDACGERATAPKFWSLDQTMSGSWLHIPARSNPWTGRIRDNNWRVQVFYPDGGIELHDVVAPERELKLRIARKDYIQGAALYDPDKSNRLLMTYGRARFDKLL